MSNRATTWAYAQRGLKVGPKFVLVTLADMADQDHSCFPGVPMLAELTGASESAVRSHLQALSEAGYFTIEKRHKANGARKSNRYYLAVDNSDLASDSGARPTARIRHTQSQILEGRFTEPSLNHQSQSSVTEPHQGAPVDNSTDDRAAAPSFPKPAPPAHPDRLDTIAVLAAVGQELADTGIDDEIVEQLGRMIVDQAAAQVRNRTRYVIKALTDRQSRPEWIQTMHRLVAERDLSRARRVLAEDIPEGNRF